MKAKTAAIVVFITASSKCEARRISGRLVENRLAACVNVIPAVESVYVWQGKIECAKEFLLVAKTQPRLFSKLERAVKKLHSYQCPEIIAFPITKGEKGYLKWIKESVGA